MKSLLFGLLIAAAGCTAGSGDGVSSRTDKNDDRCELATQCEQNTNALSCDEDNGCEWYTQFANPAQGDSGSAIVGVGSGSGSGSGSDGNPPGVCGIKDTCTGLTPAACNANPDCELLQPVAAPCAPPPAGSTTGACDGDPDPGPPFCITAPFVCGGGSGSGTSGSGSGSGSSGSGSPPPPGKN